MDICYKIKLPMNIRQTQQLIYYNPIQLRVSAFKVTINNKTGNVHINVAWRCVRVTTVVVEQQNYYTMLYILSLNL